MRHARSQAECEQIVKALEADIIFGGLSPRVRLVEDELIERFGVKRHVVRQALAQLEKMGIVSRQAYKGAMVREFTDREVEEIYELRELLEERAARSLPIPASATLLEKLVRVQKAHDEAVRSGNLADVFKCNNVFHDTLFGACGNAYLLAEIRNYAWLAHAIRSYRMADPELLELARREHWQMVEALQSGDRERLVKLCIDHIKPSKEAYLRMNRKAAASAAQVV